MIRLATLFSGIGAIEQAFIKLGIDHKIVFACDNGERELPYTKEEIINNMDSMSLEEKNQYINELYSSLKKPNCMYQTYKENYNVKLDLPLLMATLNIQSEDKTIVFSSNLST